MRMAKDPVPRACTRTSRPSGRSTLSRTSCSSPRAPERIMASGGGRKHPAPRAAPAKRRAGLPDEASVVSEATLVSPKGTIYRIVRTNEKDPYEEGRPKKKKKKKKKKKPSR